MEPTAFIVEVYRRMSLRSGDDEKEVSWEDIRQNPIVKEAIHHYRDVLPENKDAAILDIGFGNGWFLAVAIELGYRNIYGAEFGGRKQWMKDWSPAIRDVFNVETDIHDFLADKSSQFDFIHLSHVIEHIPKYSLLDVGDALFSSLKKDGVVVLRTPNMEGPCANSILFVTLAHEYGFSGSNLRSLLEICNFDDVRILDFSPTLDTLKKRLGHLLRWPILRWNRAKHRLFGVNYGGEFGAELIVSARRGERPALLKQT